MTPEELVASAEDNLRRGNAYFGAVDYKHAAEPYREALHRCREDYHAKVISFQKKLGRLREAHDKDLIAFALWCAPQFDPHVALREYREHIADKESLANLPDDWVGTS